MFKNSFKNKFTAAVLAFFIINFISPIFPAFGAEEAAAPCRYPDYCKEYIGQDKFEKFNRKMFNFNAKLNKYALRPIHVVWASIMPKYGMDRIQNAYKNIEYPKRLVSTLLQKDLKAAKTETLRFLANSTIGLGGMYDPAKRFFKLEPQEEDIEQGLSKCKIKRGPFLVLPVINATTPRALAGRLLETGLDPTTYIASPVAALVKMGLFINRTSFMQPLSIYMERTYADPYDITRKLYGMENYIKNSNLDRKEVLDEETKIIEEVTVDSGAELMASTDGSASLMGEGEVLEIPEENQKKTPENDKELLTVSGEPEAENKTDTETDKIATNEVLKGGTYTDDTLKEAIQSTLEELKPDIVLEGFKPQSPVVDSMRTALFDLPGIDESIWSELSIWNRSFAKRIRTSSIELTPEREKYKYRYIMQRDKSAPVAILYPSIGEGIMSHHSVVLAKLFYDAGYSVVIQGSHFHWEFIKSMPKDYRPGLPSRDAENLKIATGKILNALEEKYETKFTKKVLLGTSFGAMTTLFVADKESKENTLGIDSFISINPPVELMFALKELDKNNDDWNKNPSNLKHKTAVTAAKILKLFNQKDEPDFKLETLPFSDYEGKLITGFILRQKLSDLIYTIENSKETDKSALYGEINNMSFRDYAQKYLVKDENKTIDNLAYEASLHSISKYLKNNSNYKIYHTIDDYFANKGQLRKLKEYSGKNTVLISNGGHLGYLYRQEFIDELKKDIELKDKITSK
ncbi:MAG: MlaA family lipoprotein [Candidatus Gastranaerophilales bacterium]|nr:MlaA family lipoprotein [Candidatus Gastranaerophilales bacterium]